METAVEGRQSRGEARGGEGGEAGERRRGAEEGGHQQAELLRLVDSQPGRVGRLEVGPDADHGAQAAGGAEHGHEGDHRGAEDDAVDQGRPGHEPPAADVGDDGAPGVATPDVGHREAPQRPEEAEEGSDGGLHRQELLRKVRSRMRRTGQVSLDHQPFSP